MVSSTMIFVTRACAGAQASMAIDRNRNQDAERSETLICTSVCRREAWGHPSSFILHPSSFILHPSSLVVPNAATLASMSRRPKDPGDLQKSGRLIQDIRLLGRILPDVIREQEGADTFELIERIGQL